MSNETIMLAKMATPKLIKDDGYYYISEKIDGQPVCITMTKGGLTAKSRQDKNITSIQHILDEVGNFLPVGEQIVGELYIKGQGSAEISGHVRRDKPCPELTLYLFPEFTQCALLCDCIKALSSEGITGKSLKLHLFGDPDKLNLTNSFHYCFSGVRVNNHKDKCFEGYIARDEEGFDWEAGKRSNGYLKLIEEPTMDMKVIRVEEARAKKDTYCPKGLLVAKKGEGLGRVGRFIVEWEDAPKGFTHVAVGKMTHEKAKELWEHFIGYSNPHAEWADGMIIEVKYKPDAKYTTPRQATFQRFRYDKNTYETNFPKD